ncbi:MAG: CoA transferase [Proteobacteria bacterium]|nr:CoA transferase [Pseudomonadota bacterium]
MSADRSPGALAGLRVIDLTRVLGGPFCTQTLADHGAEVIKIEPPQGDEVRDWGPPFRDGVASYYVGINRNKRAMALDLGDAKGRDVLLRLLARADVLVENYKTGTFEKWGIGYHAVLAERFPKLIHCKISGFGADGPRGGMPGYDAVIQAMAGLMSINGTPDSGPTRIGNPVVDLGTGLSAAIAILMAVYERQASGRGQYVQVSLYDTAISLLHPQAANFFMSGKPPVITGNAHPNITPYDAFPTRTKQIFLAVGNDRQFARLTAELGAPELAQDARFRTNQDRRANREALTEILRGLLADQAAEPLADKLLAAGVPAGPVQDIPGVMADAHTRHTGMVVEDGAYRGTGTPMKFSRTPARPAEAPHPFSADSRAVLSESGFSSTEIEALIAEGIVPAERRR